ncbi:hypothetical protein QZR13_25990, partial [Serratia marcescens]|uniref:hypothetical protein n=1 Tax=Serratia marcescens TaxID=615 RepID=UPI0027477262
NGGGSAGAVDPHCRAAGLANASRPRNKLPARSPFLTLAERQKHAIRSRFSLNLVSACWVA